MFYGTRISLFVLALSLLSNTVLYVLYKNERQTKQFVLEENKELRSRLSDLTEKHTKLKNLCELDKHKIENRYKALLQKAMQPAKTVEIPVVIEKPIYLTNEDCQRMGVMIDEALSVISTE